MAVVMEWYENGIVTDKDLDGLSMTWGNYEAMIQMMEKIVFRQGVGDVFAEGIVRAAPKFGKEAEKYVSHSKGLTMAGIDPRMLIGMSLGFATSTRGACHLLAMVPVEFPVFPAMTPEEAEVKFGTREVTVPTSYKKAAPLIYYQHLSLIPDFFEICRFIFRLGGGSDAFSYDNLFDLYAYATGIRIDEKEMANISERLFNLERAFSNREGIRRKDDHLIGKWAEEAVPNGTYKGEKIDPEKWEEMLDDYYRLRGWDKNGVPKREKLKQLGLEDVATSLESSGAYS
jgi:aldehyde:ferredoxin oxidoreductase